jgi:pimeloyl-ACP methyl ester carboxylesterase
MRVRDRDCLVARQRQGPEDIVGPIQGPPIETGTVVVDGVATFFRRLPGEGPPAVFVHGNPTHSEDWLPILERMRGPALALDLPGWGRSARPDPERFDYSMRGLAGFFTRFLERMEIGEHSLVIHDWGSVALIPAQAEPQRVQGLVVINAVPLLPGYRWHRTARIWRAPRLGELSSRVWSRRALDLGLRESRGDWSRHPPHFVDLIWDHLDRGTLDAVLRLYRSAPEDELEAAGGDLGSIAAPALVVWGLKDRYIPARFGRLFADALPNSELVELPESGHWPWRDEPEAIERIAAFLEQATAH